MKRHFDAFKENFTAEFRFVVTEIIVDAEQRMAAARRHSHPLTDKGGSDCQQYCGWFICFDDDDKIIRIARAGETIQSVYWGMDGAIILRTERANVPPDRQGGRRLLRSRGPALR